MRIDDLRTTLRDLADEAEVLPLTERLRGIDAHTRRDRRRRRLAGATAGMVALAAVGVGLSVSDRWRADSSDPVDRPDGSERVETITEEGVTIQVNPGNLRLLGHRVETSHDGEFNLEVVSSNGDLRWGHACSAPALAGTPQVYWVRVRINGVPAPGFGCSDNSRLYTRPLKGDQGPTLDRASRIAQLAQRYGIQPDHPIQLTLRVVEFASGEPVSDPTVALGLAAYDVTGGEETEQGEVFPQQIEHHGSNYRLTVHEVTSVSEPLSFDVTTSASRLLCEYRWSGAEDISGRVNVEVTDSRMESRSARPLTWAGDRGRTFVRDGDTVRVAPWRIDARGTLAVAVYQIDD